MIACRPRCCAWTDPELLIEHLPKHAREIGGYSLLELDRERIPKSAWMYEHVRPPVCGVVDPRPRRRSAGRGPSRPIPRCSSRLAWSAKLVQFSAHSGPPPADVTARPPGKRPGCFGLRRA